YRSTSERIASSSRCETPGLAFPSARCLACSNGSTAWRAHSAARMKDRASALRLSTSWSGCMTAPSPLRAASAKARRSPSRSPPATKDVPVSLLSARAGEDASVEAREAGADDYIVKPFSARDLRVRVEAQVLRAEIRAVEATHDRRLAEIFRSAPVAVALLRGP